MDSKQKRQHPPVVGDPAPDFCLLDMVGDSHTLSAAVRDRPTPGAILAAVREVAGKNGT